MYVYAHLIRPNVARIAADKKWESAGRKFDLRCYVCVGKHTKMHTLEDNRNKHLLFKTILHMYLIVYRFLAE